MRKNSNIKEIIERIQVIGNFQSDLRPSLTTYFQRILEESNLDGAQK
jgi:hypothetical protein